MASWSEIVRGVSGEHIHAEVDKTSGNAVGAQSGDWLKEIDRTLSASRTSLVGVGIEPVADISPPAGRRIPTTRDSDDLMARIALMA